MRVAIIGGTGKMGRWLANFLLRDGKEVTVIGRNEAKLREVRQQLGVEATTGFSPAVGNADVVLISVPIDSFEEVVRELAPHLKPGQIIVDITSVKAFPVAVMHQYLKAGSVLGTHPMFGPGARDIHNQNFVLTPTNDAEEQLAGRVKQYLEERGARATLMTPDEHDEMMAVVLGLAHFIAIVSADTLLSFDRFKETAGISGTTYRVLLALVESVLAEDPELYAALQMHLPGMAAIEERFLKNSQRWVDIVRKKDRQGFIAWMNDLKQKLERKDPDFRTAYENIYKLLGGS